MWGRTSIPGLAPDGTSDSERLRVQICTILRTQLGHDFSDYRKQTFMRRVERRMQVTNAASLEDYVGKLSASPDEANMLFRDLLIRVTSFFRDQETFETLESKVIPLLFEDKHADATVRLWVPGCATGEEAYSLAILLCEYMDRMKGAPKVQIFATDIDDSAITAARLGRYPAGLLEGLSPQRIERFFTMSHGSYVVSKEIRNLCTFSVHSLVRDPPFSMMSLVSCRNLLIYMNAELQAKVIPVFHYALVPDGILLLGGAESVAQHSDLFSTVDKTARIFQRRGGRSPEINLSWQRPMPESSHSPTMARLHRGSPLPLLRMPARLPVAPTVQVQVRTRNRFRGRLATRRFSGPVEPSAGGGGRSCRARSPTSAKNCSRSPSSTRRRWKNCAAPTRSCIPSTKKCSPPTRSSKPRRRNCSRSTKSCTP